MKFLVIGDLCIDVFIYGRVDRLSPEAPIPVFIPTRKVTNDGMAGNVIANIKSLIAGNPTYKVDSFVSVNKRETFPTKTRYVDEASNHYFIRVDEGENTDTFPLDMELMPKWIGEADCIVISDYDKGYLSNSDIINICKYKAKNAVVFLDTKKTIYEDVLYFVDFVKFNKVEYAKHKALLEDCKTFNHKIIVTKGGEGVEYDGEKFEGENVVTMDVSGAGDTFLAGLVVKYMETRDIKEAIRFANKIAVEVVKKRGVASI